MRLSRIRVAVLKSSDAGFSNQEEALAKKLKLTVLDSWQNSDFKILFVFKNGRLNLFSTEMPKSLVFVDFLDWFSQLKRSRGLGKDNLLIKSLGDTSITKFWVLDAAAGLGKDATAIAGSGVRVHSIERSPFVFALLEDGLQRAQELTSSRDRDWLNLITIEQVDCCEYLQKLERLRLERPNVIYFDPMFPTKT